jgi:hypothetical protein
MTQWMTRWLVAIALAAAACGPSARKEDVMSEAKKLDDLLGVRVFQGKPGLHVYIHEPSPQLGLYEAYARFDGDAQALRALGAELSLDAAGTQAAGGHLPASWHPPAGVSLPWWDASPETPPNAVARAHGSNGWIVAKLERGGIYLIATDTRASQP